MAGLNGATKGAAAVAIPDNSLGISFLNLYLIPPRKKFVLGVTFVIPPLLRNCLGILPLLIIYVSIVLLYYLGRDCT